MSAKIDMLGKTYGRLTVVGEAKSDTGCRMLRCVCECGNEKLARPGHIRVGDTTSCGCGPNSGVGARGTGPAHGQSRTPLYTRWRRMIDRVENPKNRDFRHYGGRGITICERWREPNGQGFLNFAADMGPTFQPDLTLERVDVDGPYSPGNCCWATRAEQNRNQRRNRYVTWRGRTMVVADWADLLGLNYDTLRRRLYRSGWSVERALSTGADPKTLAALGDDLPHAA